MHVAFQHEVSRSDDYGVLAVIGGRYGVLASDPLGLPIWELPPLGGSCQYSESLNGSYGTTLLGKRFPAAIQFWHRITGHAVPSEPAFPHEDMLSLVRGTLHD